MLDVILVAVIIAAAVGFLVWNFSGSAPKPACHTSGGAPVSSSEPQVILGASLSRGLARAAARNRSGS